MKMTVEELDLLAGLLLVLSIDPSLSPEELNEVRGTVRVVSYLRRDVVRGH